MISLLIISGGGLIKKSFLSCFFLILFLLFWTYLNIDCFKNVSSLSYISLDLNFKVLNLYPDLPDVWNCLKSWYLISFFFSFFIMLCYVFYYIFFIIKKGNNKKESIPDHFSQNKLFLLVGVDPKTNSIISLPEKGLFQNILITGTIGTGKTSSAMYPFTRQLIYFRSSDSENKLGMLILDVKGNYYHYVLKCAKESGRLDDVIVIELNGKYKYNPIHKPNLKPSVIANQLKSILLLFSPNNTESYWLDKAEAVLGEAIKLCRLYNHGYVTFEEIHKIITQEEYYYQKIALLRQQFLNNSLPQKSLYDLLSCIHFFQKEFFSLDSRTLNILKSEITRITNCFILDYDVMHTFCPHEKDLNFFGFQELIEHGKIVVLNMNINEYRNLSKIIAAYLKMDFQTAVMNRLAHLSSSSRTVAFISDEYSEYVTALDANFFSQSREANCINIVSTQSYTSLLNTLNNSSTVKVIVQSLVNKFWFRSDDLFTIEDAQKQIGKQEKERSSQTFSENAKDTFYDCLLHTFRSRNSNISESINHYTQLEYVYDTNFFTQQLETFSALVFLSDGSKILPPQKVKMIPFFKKQEDL